MSSVEIFVEAEPKIQKMAQAPELASLFIHLAGIALDVKQKAKELEFDPLNFNRLLITPCINEDKRMVDFVVLSSVDLVGVGRTQVATSTLRPNLVGDDCSSVFSFTDEDERPLTDSRGISSPLLLFMSAIYFFQSQGEQGETF